MIAVGTTVRVLAIVAALLSVAACDDDERKNKLTKYDVTIYVSDHIVGEIVKVPAERRFAKPRIVVQTPEGVKVEHEETKPRTGKIVDFAPVTLPAIIILLLATALIGSCFHQRRLNLQV